MLVIFELKKVLREVRVFLVMLIMLYQIKRKLSR